MKTTEPAAPAKAPAGLQTPFFGKSAGHEILPHEKPPERFFAGAVQAKPADAASTPPEGGANARLRIQPKLIIGPPGDRYEQEADAVAEQVMRSPAGPTRPGQFLAVSGMFQRKCSECSREDEKIQRKSDTTVPQSASDLSSRIDHSRGQGSPLPDNTRAFMETRIGADFSDVRIHTHPEAVRMSQDLQARAFTYGNDVYFGAGQYAPDSAEGNRLLAHELTHVVQQSGDKAQRKFIQRQRVFGPAAAGSFLRGNTIHSIVIKEVTRTAPNKNLVGEGPVPGANRMGQGSFGSADFYMPFWNGGGSPPLTGLNMTAPGSPPEFLPITKTPLLNGAKYTSWRNHSAPRLISGGRNKKRGAAPADDDRVDRLDYAPHSILLGELKPGGEWHAGSFLGGASQLPTYRNSILSTQASLNNYLSINPNARATGQTQTDWKLKDVGFIKQMFFSPDIDYKNGGKGALPKQWSGDLSVFQFPGGRKVADAHLKGGLFIYPVSAYPGLWLYEWLPYKDQLLLVGSSQSVNDIVVRLNNNVIPTLQTKRIQRKPAAAPPQGAAFTAAYQTWKQEAETVLAGSGTELSQTAEAVLDAKARIPSFTAPVPARAQKAGREYKTVKNWVERGSLFGRLRLALGGIFGKIKGFFQKLGEKFKLPAKGDTSSGDKILSTIFKMALDIGKAYIKLLVGRVSIDLQMRLQTGMRTLLKEYFTETIGEAFQGEIGAFQKVLEQLENFKEEQIDEQFAPILSIYEDLKWFAALRAKVTAIGDVVQKVRWIIRAIQCVTPPVVGCLKLLLSPLTNYLIRRAVKSCTFQEEVFVPVMNRFSFFRDLPTHISDAILGIAGDLMPLPDSWKKALFAKQGKIDSEFKTGDLDCNAEERANALNLRFAQLEDQYGRERIQLLLDILNKNKVDKNAELRSESELDRLEKALEELAPVSDVTLIVALEQIKESPPESFVALEELVKGLKAFDPSAREKAAQPDAGGDTPGSMAVGPSPEAEGGPGGGAQDGAGDAPAGPVVQKRPNPDVKKVGQRIDLDIEVWISQATLKLFLGMKPRSLQHEKFPASVSISKGAVTAQITETKIYIRSVSGTGGDRLISFGYTEILSVPDFGQSLWGGKKRVKDFGIH